MKLKHTKVAILAATLITFGSLAGEADGAITITFEETGGDVIASTSGSVVVPSTTLVNFSGTFLVGTANRLSWLDGNIDRYSGGSFGGLTLSLVPTSGSGDAFGIEDEFIYFEAPVGVGTTYTPTTTWTWTGQTLSSIGLGSLSTSPTLVYTADNGETVSIVAASAVPEPSSALLFGLGALGFATHRRRTK